MTAASNEHPDIDAAASLQDEVEALRNALLEALLEVAGEMRNTVEGRETVAALFEARAHAAHPSVAEVLRGAAERVRQQAEADR